MRECKERSLLSRMMLSTPAALSMLLLAAHFLRSDDIALAVVCLLVPLLMLSKRNFPIRILQGALFLAGLIWINTIMTIYKVRVALDEPWGRMAIILLIVASFAIVSLLLLEIRISGTKLVPTGRNDRSVGG